MEFFSNIKKSIYSPEYYQTLLGKPFSYSLKYFVLFSLLVALIGAVFVTAFFVPKLTTWLDTTANNAVADYPANLAVAVKDGKVSTNVKEPYFVMMPRSFQNNTDGVNVNGGKLDNFKYLLVIDTQHDITIEQFKSDNTFILLGKDSVAFYKDGGISVQLLPSTLTMTVDKNAVQMVVDKVKPLIKFLYPLLFALSFVLFFILLMLRLVYLLLVALLVLLVAKVKGLPIGYGKSYQLGMHLLTGATIAQCLLMIAVIWIPLNPIPFFTTIVLVILAAINLKKPVAQPTVAATV